MQGRRRSAPLLFLLLLPLLLPVSATTASTGGASAELGRYDVVPGLVFGTWADPAGDLLVLTTDARLRLYRPGVASLTLLWEETLEYAPRSATYDPATERLAVIEADQVEVRSSRTGALVDRVNRSAVSSVAWDDQGWLWLPTSDGHQASPHRAGLPTNRTTDTLDHAIAAIGVLADGSVVTVDAYGGLVRSADNGTMLHSSTSPIARHLALVPVPGGDLLEVGAAGLLRRIAPSLNETRWTMQLPTDCAPQHVAVLGAQLVLGCQHRWVHTVNMNGTVAASRLLESPLRAAVDAVDGRRFLFVAGSLATELLLLDVDSDGDGWLDGLDAFPDDPTQYADRDGDGRGDALGGHQPDACPDDPLQWDDADGDGVCDRPVGSGWDLFPDDPFQHSDRDGDGRGDVSHVPGGDRWPDDATQWVDADGDGYGDNAAGTQGDACPMLNGRSFEDRFGCPDRDGDGWSDPDPGWLASPDGTADAFPSDASQHADRDGDGFGDATDGWRNDRCPASPGTSRRLLFLDLSGQWSVSAYAGCDDRDGDGWADVGDHFPDNATEYLDADGDGVGLLADADDNDVRVTTRAELCATARAVSIRSCRATSTTVTANPAASVESTPDLDLAGAVVVMSVAGFSSLLLLVVLQLFVLPMFTVRGQAAAAAVDGAAWARMERDTEAATDAASEADGGTEVSSSTGRADRAPTRTRSGRGRAGRAATEEE